ncbi:MAG: cyclic nucleotide-binding domain-containing protein [Alphaproteobacteria bacterium]|nr:cyclic nucleotide-binding domain-containing protein [Alphaproteobacteria bacterium]
MSAPSSPLQRKDVAAGDMIYEAGDPGATAYLIQSGRIELLARDSLGFYETVGVREAGQVFGELALVREHERETGARALIDSQVVAVERTGIERKLAEADPFVAALFRILAGNLESIVERSATERRRSAREQTPCGASEADLEALSGAPIEGPDAPET